MPDSLLPTLDKLPRHAYTFLWADYVELLCLCNSNGLVSRGNLQAQVQESEDTQNDFTEAEEDGDEDHLTDAGHATELLIAVAAYPVNGSTCWPSCGFWKTGSAASF